MKEVYVCTVVAGQLKGVPGPACLSRLEGAGGGGEGVGENGGVETGMRFQDRLDEREVAE